jgi:ribosomal-protein-serine acetyltransferase
MRQILPDTLRAGQIVLRRTQLSDAPEVLAAAGASIKELSAFLRWAAADIPSLSQFERRIAEQEADFLLGTGFAYVLRDSLTCQVIGEAGGKLTPGGEAFDIGYWIRSDMTGRGHATAAARVLTSLAFDAYPSIQRVEIRMDKGNAASQTIAVRLGFERVGSETFCDEPLSGQTGKGHIYAMTRENWSS